MNSKPQTLNSILNTQYSILFFILIICQLSTVNGQLSFAAGNLEVEGNLEINSTTSDNRSGIVLQPLSAVPAEPSPQVKGEFYHNDTTGPNYYDGSSWKSIGGGAGSGKDKRVATKIVAASDSLDKTKADYVCDGTDDQVEIQAAIDALGSSGGAVYLLEGTYNISASINLNNIAPNDSNKAIIGTGAGTVLKAANSSMLVIFASSVNNIFISQLKIDGNKTAFMGNAGIWFNTVTYSKINKVWVIDAGYYGIYLESCTYNIISNNNIQGTGGNGFGIFLVLSNNNIITGNQSYLNNSSGIYLQYCSKNIISINNCSNNGPNGGYGIGLFSDGVKKCDNNVISGNNCQGNTSDGIRAEQCHSNTISANNIQSNNRYGIYLVQCNNNGISSNSISLNRKTGIYESSGASNNISGNMLYDNGANYDWFGDGNSIYLSSSNSIVSSNRIYDSIGGAYGIIIPAGSNDNYIVGNYIDGAGFNGIFIQDQGANTKYTQKEKITLERQTTASPNNGSTLDVSTVPQGYLPLAPTSAITLNTTTAITDGKSIGDTLILEGTSDTYTVTIQHGANVILGKIVQPPGLGYRILGRGDILKLLWNGTDWIEIAFSNN